MSEVLYKDESYGFLAAIPPDTWTLHPWTSNFTESGNFRTVTITNGGEYNEGLVGNLYFRFRTDDIVETCDKRCGLVTVLHPGDSAEIKVGYGMKLWLQVDTADIAVKVEEIYPI